MADTKRKAIWDFYVNSIKTQIIDLGKDQDVHPADWEVEAYRPTDDTFQIKGTCFLKGTPAFKFSVEMSINENTNQVQAELMTSRRVAIAEGIAANNVFYNPEYLSSKFKAFIREVDFYVVTNGKSRPKPQHYRFG